MKLLIASTALVGALLGLQSIGDEQKATQAKGPTAARDAHSAFPSPAVEATRIDNVPVAPAVSDRPAVPVDPKATQRSRDLKATLDTFIAHMDASAGYAIKARSILDLCGRIAADLSQPGSTALPIAAQDEHYALRTIGAAELAHRCGGVARLAGTRKAELRQQIDDALARAGEDPAEASLHSSVLTPHARLRSILDSGRGGDMERILPALQRAYAVTRGIDEDSVASEELAMAFAAVACGIDGSCAPDSLDSLLRCVYQSSCNAGSANSRLLYSQIEDGRVLHYAELSTQLISLIQHRDFRQLGIDE